jgi:hypothetical protein
MCTDNATLPQMARIAVQCLRTFVCGPVVGGGAASMSARVDARRAGADVTAVDANAHVVWLEVWLALLCVCRVP